LEKKNEELFPFYNSGILAFQAFQAFWHSSIPGNFGNQRFSLPVPLTRKSCKTNSRHPARPAFILYIHKSSGNLEILIVLYNTYIIIQYYTY
jgi:hypothetical protein